jgi:Ca2+-transporting ATPase
VLTEMVVDPVCSLAFEGAPEDPRVMRRPPRRSDEGIVGWPMLWRGLLQGGCLLAATLAIYLLALQGDRDADVARTLAVIGLTVGNLLLVAVNLAAGIGPRAIFARSAFAFWAVAAAAAGALAVAVAVPGARRLLHFAVPAAGDLLLANAVVAIAVLVGATLSARLSAVRPASVLAERPAS